MNFVFKVFFKCYVKLNLDAYNFQIFQPEGWKKVVWDCYLGFSEKKNQYLVLWDRV